MLLAKILVILVGLPILLLGVFGARKAYAQDDSWNTWNHNSSTVYLASQGRQRAFYYLHPRAGLASRGVQSGTLLFSGTRSNFNYSGTAYVFSPCGPIAYEVSGSLSSDLKHIRLYGRAPVVDRNCNVSSYRDDVLDFETIDQADCGCQCPGEIPVADLDEWVQSGDATSCPYLYAWSDKDRAWKSYGKVIHVAQGPDRETAEEVNISEFSTRFRLSEEEPENSFIDKVELRVETDDGAIYSLRPNIQKLTARDKQYLFISAYKSVDFGFKLPKWVSRRNVRRSTLIVTGYYERLGSARPVQCYARIAGHGSKRSLRDEWKYLSLR
jgi:hypothetical protein